MPNTPEHTDPHGECAAEIARVWQPIETAPKDGTRVLVYLKNPIPRDRADLRAWDGIPFVARHQGLGDNGFDVGWNFAAPVGHGGFPDEWIAGWQPIPEPPHPALEGKT